MICYPAGVTDVEILVINDYWQLKEEVEDEFQYTLNQIDNNYKDYKVRPVSYLAGKSFYFIIHHAFICQDCNRKSPVRTRTEYLYRMASERALICSECMELRRDRLSEDACSTLKEYKAETLKPEFSLNSLSIEELISLLSISMGQPGNSEYLGPIIENITITGIASIDQKIVLSLIDKKALVHITDLPSAVERANDVLYDEYSRKSYDNRYHGSVSYRHPDIVSVGVYINSSISEDSSSADNLSSILYQRVKTAIWTLDDVENIYELIYDIQLDKLYQLILEISKEKKLKIENSNVLRALLDHLVSYYQPQKVFFTFMVKAREAIEYIYKESIPVFKAKHYFTNFVERYIQRIESNGKKLERTWTLPPNIQISSFEAIFSQIYLKGHINWNDLSVREVAAIMLENITMTEEAEALLTESDDN